MISVASPSAAQVIGVPAAPQPAPVVEVRALRKTFRTRRAWSDLVRRPFARGARTTVVDDVSFDVGESELFGVLGTNGAGKTTLFRMLSGQLIADQGTATILGNDVAADTRYVRSLVTPATTDERSLYWRLSAAENLELFAELFALPKPGLARRIADMLERVELHDAGAKMVGTFSAGMKQRLLIARALLPSPRVLLLDEPTRSLDPISARELRRFLKQDIVGRDGCTVLLATHNGEEAMEVCDRVAVLDRGRLLAVDGARALAERLGDARLCVWTTEPDHPAFASLATTGLALREPVRELPRDGWSPVVLRVAPDDASGAAVLSRLAAANVPISRAERMTMSLAELIERVTAAGGA